MIIVIWSTEQQHDTMSIYARSCLQFVPITTAKEDSTIMVLVIIVISCTDQLHDMNMTRDWSSMNQQ